MSERRQRAARLASALAFLSLAAVAVLIVVSQNQTSGGDASNIRGAAEVDAMLKGSTPRGEIAQSGLVLQKSGAPVTLVEFGDLQCPRCKAFAEDMLPQLIEGPVREGKAGIEFRNYPVVGAESQLAAAAVVAAGERNRGWNFIELFYRNQGNENSGYVTDEFLIAIARAAGISDIHQWNRDRHSKAVLERIEENTSEAQEFGLTGTPSFGVIGPGTSGLEPIETPDSVADLEAAIASASHR